MFGDIWGQSALCCLDGGRAGGGEREGGEAQLLPRLTSDKK